MKLDNNSKTKADRLEAAFLQGPPQEVCMVLEYDKLRHFNLDEQNVIGTRPVEPRVEGPQEFPLYGKDEPGWKLVLEE